MKPISHSGVRAFLIVSASCTLIAGCSGDYGASPEDVASAERTRDYDPGDSVFGDGGLSLSRIASGEAFGGGVGPNAGGSSLPVNKFLWRGALDTLQFLPLASTDPFTGVIATEWGTNPERPNERFKVTAYMVNSQLAASSLKVAVFRETRDDGGPWVPAPVSAETARKLEDAILTRARQLRIAEINENQTG